MRFAIVVGHRRSRMGARSLTGRYEWEWNIPLAGRLCGELQAWGHEADLVFRPDRSSGAMTVLVANLNAGNYDAVISLHFNAGGGGSGGHLMLHYPGSTRGEGLAEACREAHNSALPDIRDRGLWPTKVNGAGTELYILTRTTMPVCLVESHFGDSPDHEYCTPRRELLAVALGEALNALAMRDRAGGQW